MKDKHAERVAIYKDTLSILRDGGYLSASGKEILLPSADEAQESSRWYKEEFRVSSLPATEGGTSFLVEEKDCVEAAAALQDKGYNPALLNLADLYIPGGLVEYGSGAQEENLCRRSNLMQSLYQYSRSRIRLLPDLELKQNEEQYPMDEKFGGVYSGKVLFFRSTEKDGSVLLDDPRNIPVISVAAISGPGITPEGNLYPEDEALTREKMRTIMRIGLDNGHDSLVLSAFGCGAFSNPPAAIARLFHETLLEDEFRDRYRLVDFAILDGYRTGMSHNPEGNFLPFQREFASGKE
ncbi:MAG: TIGR02452 family protein [Bacteroidales bacterium]|nr:TIGR02452 family protein [Bacteroidales bacterium]